MDMGTDAPVAGVPPALTSMQSTQDGGSGFNLDLARSLRMHRKLAIAVGVVILLLLIPLGVTRKPAYQATTLIYVQPVSSKAPTDASMIYDSARYDTYMEQQLLTFHRPDILGRALDQFPPAVRATFVPDRDKAIKQLDTDLTITREQGSYQIAVMAIERDPNVVAPIANGVTLAFLENGQQDDLALNHQQLDSLLQDRKQIEDELDKDRQEQADLSTTLGMADTNSGDAGNPFDANLADLRSQLAVARNAHDVAEAQLASVSGKSQFNPAAASAAKDDVEVSALKANLGARRAALITEMNGLTTTNPLYKKDQAELDQLSQTVNDLTSQVARKSGQNLKSELQLEAERTGDVLARLEGELGSQTAAATATTPKLQRAQDLTESIKELQARYADVDNAVHNLMLAQGPTFAAHITLQATTPTSPLPSKKIGILVLALPIAFFFGIAAVLIRQKLDARVYIGEDINRLLNIPPMAVLPETGEVAGGAKEEFLFRLVAGIEQAHRVGGASTFIFTTSSQGTPIEDIVASVSADLESLGYRTMALSAAETLSPIGSKAERPSPEQRANTSELATANGHAGVRIRREGVIDEHMERLKETVDFLFIRAQPLRSSAQTEFVVRLGDVTVLIAESGRTTRKELKSCLSIIHRLRARGLAIVVSNLKLRNADDEFIEAVKLAESGQYRSRTPKSRDETVAVGRV